MRSLLSIIHDYDILFFNQIFRIKKVNLTGFFSALTYSADGFLYPLVVAAFCFAVPEHSLSFFYLAIVSFALEIIFYLILKKSLKRKRPYQVLPDVSMRKMPPDMFSFPSGHTAAAFVIVSLATIILPFTTPYFFVWALLVGLSRIYLGLHFPTDILAGIVLGKSSVYLAIIITGVTL